MTCLPPDCAVSAGPLAETRGCIDPYLTDPLHGSELTDAWTWVDQLSRRLERATVVASPRTLERLEELPRTTLAEQW